MKRKPTAPKPIWESKTFWFNVASVLLVVFTELLASPEMLPFDKDKAVFWLTLAITAINIALRMYTHRPIEATPGARILREKKIEEKNAANNSKNENSVQSSP